MGLNEPLRRERPFNRFSVWLSEGRDPRAANFYKFFITSLHSFPQKTKVFLKLASAHSDAVVRLCYPLLNPLCKGKPESFAHGGSRRSLRLGLPLVYAGLRDGYPRREATGSGVSGGVPHLQTAYANSRNCHRQAHSSLATPIRTPGAASVASPR
jgi:hypothetical protein